MQAVIKKSFFSKIKEAVERKTVVENLSQGKINKDYKVTSIDAKDQELKSFLFSLGCYEGEVVTLISIICDNYVINIKDARYSIDNELAKAVKVEEI